MKLKFIDLDKKTKYKIMSETIIPRPIAWVVTENERVINIAPFSYFVPLSSEPPTLLVSIGHKKDGTPKDTLRNTLKTQKASICITPISMVEKMYLTSEALPEKESEASKFGIMLERIEESFPPIIKGVDVAYFCSFLKKVDIGGSTIPLIYEILSVYLNDEIIKDKKRMQIDFDAVGRIGKKFAIRYKTIELK